MIQRGKIRVATEMMKVEHRFINVAKDFPIPNPVLEIDYRPLKQEWTVRLFGQEHTGRDIDELLNEIFPDK